MVSKKIIFLAIVAGTVLVLDLFTKMLVLAHLPLGAGIPVIPGLFDVTHVHNPGGAFGFALIFGGAIGNLVDRLRFGAVIDFIDVYIGDLHWPAFNIADSAITVGVAIFAFHVMFRKMPG